MARWGTDPPPNRGDDVITLCWSSVGRHGSVNASACPVRSMNESMEEMAEVMEDGLVNRGCKRGPGLVNILECDMVVGVVGYL